MEVQCPKETRQGTIDKFEGPYAFLSNFYRYPVFYNGKHYPTAEHAYQAAKCKIPADAERIRKSPGPEYAKRMGKKVNLREGWHGLKVGIMTEILMAKFSDPLLKECLKDTGTALLIEGNWWGDKFWGVCRGEGENWLGKLLMEIRTRL